MYKNSSSLLNDDAIQIIAALDSAIIVSIADKHGTIIYANPLFCEISGYTKNEFVGKNHFITSSLAER